MGRIDEDSAAAIDADEPVGDANEELAAEDADSLDCKALEEPISGLELKVL